MKKFTDITNKSSSIEFEKDKSGILSNDIDNLNDQLKNSIESTISSEEWEIVNVIDVSLDDPNIKESVIINADLTNKSVKRGDVIYIIAILHKKGSYYHQNQMGVIKVRIVEIYNSLHVLNTLK